jgi:mono/diheme cytochrome c family protein
MVLGHPHQRVFVCLAVTPVILSLVTASCSTTDRSTSKTGQSGPTVVPTSNIREVAASAIAPGDAPTPSTGAQKGKELYDTLGCAGCHKINGQGGTAGPDLSNEAALGRSRSWLASQIRNPKIHDPQTIMPPNVSLSDQQVDNLVDYLLSLGGGRAAAPSIAPGRPTAATVSSAIVAGGTQWSQRCGQCHTLRPPSEYNDAQWAVAVHHMRVRVPLTGQEQRDILAFLQASN